MIRVRGYTLTRRLESRGAADVYAGIRDRDGQPVHLRVYALDDETADRLEHEYQLIAGIESTGIVRAIALRRQREGLVLIQEAFDGIALDEYARRHRVTIDVFLSVAVQLSRALSEIHEAGVLHKDLTPRHVLIDPYQLKTRITGFTLSVEAETQVTDPELDVVRGTLPYISPEQTGRMHRRVDYRSDLYSLGATLYALATGAPPFEGDPLQIIHAHLARTPDPPHERDPTFPEMPSRIIAKLLEKEPEDRYPSASALLADFRRCQDRLDERGRIPTFQIGEREGGALVEPSDDLYGREFEVGGLRQSYQTVVRTGEMRVVMLSGAPGVGKTALVDEVRPWVDEQGGLFLAGRFDAYTNTAPFAGFRQAVSQFVDQVLTEADDVLEHWRGRLQDTLHPMAQVAVELVPKLGWLLGPQSPAPREAAESADRMVEAARRILEALATRDTPLVLFLDDLQWIDEGSLQLLEGLVASPRPLPVLFVGAYRHRDVDMDHPLAEGLERLWERDPTARALRLQPLRPADVNRLVADSLGCDEQDTRALTELVARKTDNNPLFVRQFLVYASELGLFEHDPEHGWHWDLDAMEQAGIPDDVAGMMTEKIARLPLRVQRVLKYASIAGSAFDTDTLMALDPAREELQQHLRHLVGEGLLARAADGYRFTHDRIREAVHNLIPPVEAARLYRLVGRHRLAAVDPGKLAEHIFEIVDPLNRAVQLIHDEGERLQLVELDFLAGKQALESAVSGAAETYVEVALELLREHDWDARPDLCFDLHMTAARAARQAGRVERAMDLYNTLLTREHDVDRTSRICAQLMELHTASGEPERAVAVGRMGLRRIGARRLLHGSRWWTLPLALFGWLLYWLRPQERWDDLEPARDPDWVAQRRIVAGMATPAFFVEAELIPFMVVSALWRMPRDGYYLSPGIYMAGLGMLVAHGLGWRRRGYEIGQLALRIAEQYPDAEQSYRVRHLVHGFLDPWARQWRDSLEPLREAGREAQEAGDRMTATFCAVHRANIRFLTGDPLQEVEEFAQRWARGARETGHRDLAHSLRLVGDAAFCLRGLSHEVEVSDALDLEGLRTQDSQAPWFDAVTAAALVLAVFGRYERAFAVVEQVGTERPTAFPTFMEVEFHLLRALAAAASDPGDDPAHRKRARRLLRDAIRRFRRYTRDGRVNHEPRLRVLQAERERLAGRPMQAMEHYAEARSGAAAAGLLHLRGLVLERQASLAHELGWALERRTYLRRARGVYKAWGADAKVEQLDRRHADPVARQPRASTPAPVVRRTAVEGGVESHPTRELDMTTVMATARALSEEVQLDEVIEKVVVRAIENAGANRGLLLLADGGDLRIEAEYAVDGQYRRYRPPIFVEDASARLPVSVVRFVVRTSETVVLGDASSEGQFTSDPYVAATRSRSILCVPVLKRTKLVGVLYLENSLVAQAFTEERRAVLGLLAAQAAISLENARLVEELRGARDDLEERVRERTSELISLQEDMVDAARRAGMAEVATGVLHNVGNILNSVNTSATDLQETIRRSRLPSLERTVELILANQDDLAAFLEHDERGRLVPEFLRLVTHQLESEHERMQEHIRHLTGNVEHVRQVISAQQAFAGASDLVESVSAEELIEEAIRVSGATRPWREQTVTRQFEDVASLAVERHKVLQILVNLVNNARDALDEVDEPGELRIIVATEQVDNRVRITVRDFGVGIAQENLQRIFSHGFTTKRTGHGFGLHSSAIAARQIGGRLWAESDGPGKGATFYLDLPVRGEESVRSEAG